MSISKDSQRELARVKRELGGAGKGDVPRTYGEKYDRNYPECTAEGCKRLKAKGSKFCTQHKEKGE